MQHLDLEAAAAQAEAEAAAAAAEEAAHQDGEDEGPDYTEDEAVLREMIGQALPSTRYACMNL
jgi:hypothetical protein